MFDHMVRIGQLECGDRFKSESENERESETRLAYILKMTTKTATLLSILIEK